ncbi:glycerol-3-phosphate dehydrogenase [Mesorhizobium sp. PL10]
MSIGQDKVYDLFVIGGGINGAAIACDAASRELSVALAEMQDFAQGTSSRSSKLAHGGLRYLETFDFRLVREALREREILMAKAPHLVRPLRFVLPHVASQRPRWMIRLGLFFYDYLARRRVLKRSQLVNLRQHMVGTALKDDYRHAFAYSDCRADDARLVIANLLGAQRHGAKILARHRFTTARRENGLWRVEVRDPDGVAQVVSARALVNAGGPWVIDVAGKVEGIQTARKLRMVRGSHLVVPRQWAGEHGYFLQTSDRRLIEALPYEGDFTLIGTTDEPWEDDPAKVAISEKEIDYLLGEVNAFLKRPVRRTDIVWTFSGIRPLFEVGATRDGDLSTLTRDYSFEVDKPHGEAPALTIFGGKLTTHRRLAEHAMRELATIMRWPRTCVTAAEVLPGGELGVGGLAGFRAGFRSRHAWLDEQQANRYVQTYGRRADDLLAGCTRLADLGRHFGGDLYEREVRFLMETEWAVAAEDVLWRRTKLGLRLSHDEIRQLDAFMAHPG